MKAKVRRRADRRRPGERRRQAAEWFGRPLPSPRRGSDPRTPDARRRRTTARPSRPCGTARSALAATPSPRPGPGPAPVDAPAARWAAPMGGARRVRSIRPRA